MTTPLSLPNRSHDSAAPGADATGLDAHEIARRLHQQWREGLRPDVRAFLADQAEVSLAELAEVLRVDQRERWLLGERVPAELYLREFIPLEEAGEQALDLVYAEYLLREELGEAPARAEYVERFPRLADALRLPVGFH